METGAEYPPATIYNLVLMISIHLEWEYGMKKLISHDFPDIKNTLDNIMAEKSAAGLGIQYHRRATRVAVAEWIPG